MDFIKKFVDKIQAMNKTRDPSEFNDDIALKTEWESFSKGSSNFNTHRLFDDIGYGLRYKPTKSLYFLTGIFMLLGGGTAIALVTSAIHDGKDINQDILYPALFGLIFFLIGLGLFIGLRRSVFFDQTERCMVIKDERTYFSDIHAIQLVMHRSSKHRNYQINFVLRDAGRVYVMTYADSRTARQDAVRVANLIGLPSNRIWDALPGYDDGIPPQSV